MIPEDVGWRLGAVLNCACEVNGTALVHVQVRAAQNCSGRYCNNTGRRILDMAIGCATYPTNGTNIAKKKMERKKKQKSIKKRDVEVKRGR
jgi:hypothetical protein